MFRTLMCAAVAATITLPAAAQSGGNAINDSAPSSLSVYGASGTVFDDPKVIGGPADVGPEWKQYEVRGTADKDYPAGSLGAGFQFATAKQVVDLGPVEVVDLGASAATTAAAAPAARAPAQSSTLATLDPDK